MDVILIKYKNLIKLFSVLFIIQISDLMFVFVIVLYFDMISADNSGHISTNTINKKHESCKDLCPRDQIRMTLWDSCQDLCNLNKIPKLVESCHDLCRCNRGKVCQS